ncbi:MAG TPA: hypothetical protein ACFCUY_07605 [Xenococcaceae cyanobacterium]|jgi:hypothetical protein
MPKLPRVKATEAIKALEKLGFDLLLGDRVLPKNDQIGDRLFSETKRSRTKKDFARM